MRGRQAVILAGGKGTRLASVVRDVPKPMAQVGGRPFLRFILDNLSENGFGRVVIADGYKREVIESFFGSGYRGMKILYSPEESPLLTGGAVKKALSLCESGWAFVLNGDTFFDVDYDRFEATAMTAPGSVEAVLALKEVKGTSRYGTVHVARDGMVESFVEKQHIEEGLINGGVYYMKADALKCKPKVFSLEEEYLRAAADRGSLLGVVCDGEFIDIGIPEDYERAQALLPPLVKPWKIAFFDRDGTINVDTGHLHEPEKLILIDEGVEKLRYYSQRPEYKVVVVTNQAGIAKGLYTENDMHIVHRALDEALEQLDCRIDAYYFCPHHPDFTDPCNCRKPNAGMIYQALRDFDASASDCIMFGDKQTDKQAAIMAGVRFEWIKHE